MIADAAPGRPVGALGHGPSGTPGRVMAVDHGLRRVGVAVSDPLRLFARPLVTLRVGRSGDVAAEVARLAREQAAHAIVVGLPLLPSGDAGPQAEAALAFAEALVAALARIGHDASVDCFDESHTTSGAAARAAETGRVPAAGQDAAAAALILEEWLQAGESEHRARAAAQRPPTREGEPPEPDDREGEPAAPGEGSAA